MFYLYFQDFAITFFKFYAFLDFDERSELTTLSSGANCTLTCSSIFDCNTFSNEVQEELLIKVQKDLNCSDSLNEKPLDIQTFIFQHLGFSFCCKALDKNG